MSIDLPVQEAVNGLTGFEVLQVQNHYNLLFENLGGIRTIIGTIWAYEHRTPPGKSWSDIENMPVSELNTYFKTDPDQVDSDQAKK